MLWRFKALIYDWCRTLYPFAKIYEEEISGLRSLVSEVDINNCKILDIGTGTGMTLKACIPLSENIVLMDLSADMLRRSRDNTGLSRCVVADSAALPFSDASFNLVTAIGVSEYISDTAVVFEEMARVTMLNASAIITYAPRNFTNRLRYLSGHKLYLKTELEFSQLIQRSAFVAVKHKSCCIQNQILAYKSDKKICRTS